MKTAIENRNTAARRSMILAVLMLSLMVILAMLKPVYVSAAGEASMRVNSDSVAAGEEMRVVVTAAGDDLGRVEAILKYDKSVLSYVSGGQSEGDNGAVQLKKSGTGNDIEFKLIFKAKKAGTTDLKISRAHAYDMDDRSMKCNAPKSSVTISESAGGDDQTSGDSESAGKSSGDDGSENEAGEDADSEKASGENDQSGDPEMIEQPDDQTGQGEQDPEGKGTNNGKILIIVVAAVVVIVILMIVIIMKRMRKSKNDPDTW